MVCQCGEDPFWLGSEFWSSDLLLGDGCSSYDLLAFECAVLCDVAGSPVSRGHWVQKLKGSLELLSYFRRQHLQA